VSSTVSSDAATVRPYSPGGAVSDEPSGKLSSNESALGPSPAVVQAVRAAVPDFHLYRTSDELRARLAAEVGVDAEQLLVTNGSDEVCYLVAFVHLGPGATVVTSDPPYRIDEIVSQINGATVVPVPLKDGAHDLDGLAAAARGADLLWLPTPHNPSGMAVPPERLGPLLEGVPESCLVVLDEAYRPFLPAARRPDVLDLLRRHPNLMIQRSLSKSHGLAGFRVGYLIARAAQVARLDAARAPFNVNAAALVAAEVALRERGWSEYTVERVRDERARFEAFLDEGGFTYWPSDTNFVSFRPTDSAAIVSALAKRGIAVRDGGDLGLDGWLRVTIGSAPRMLLVREALIEAEGGS
jgi:histidinol-phosphate aminotransferase